MEREKEKKRRIGKRNKDEKREIDHFEKFLDEREEKLVVTPMMGDLLRGTRNSTVRMARELERDASYLLQGASSNLRTVRSLNNEL